MLLVTGGSGFLGRHVTEELDKRGIKYFAPDSRLLNLTNKFKLNKVGHYYTWPQKYPIDKFDAILHLAAVCGGIKANSNNPATFLDSNVRMATNVYALAQKLNINVYAVGSTCSYPVNTPIPFKETDFWNGYPEATNAPYGLAKKILYMYSKTYREQYNIKGAYFIPANMYGEYDNFDLQTSHVIPALIRKFSTHKKAELWGTGKVTREFLYAKDCARALVDAYEMKLDEEMPINLGTSEEISIEDLANKIVKLTGFNRDWYFNGELDGQPRRKLDCTRAFDILGWKASTSLDQGLEQTLKYYKNK